jgi:hypothetical protein
MYVRRFLVKFWLNLTVELKDIINTVKLNYIFFIKAKQNII